MPQAPAAETQLKPDAKGMASFTFHEVIRQTAQNFPDPRFHPKAFLESPHSSLFGIDPSPYRIYVTADGIGTKPELAERLYVAALSKDASTMEGLAQDALGAMIGGDSDRWGMFLAGVANIVDMNTADPSVTVALARGMKNACDQGQFALLNGETAELGYRTSGYGNTRVNLNAVGVCIVNPAKLITGENLKPGQPVVGFREKSIRSNGLSRARAILNAGFLNQVGGVQSQAEYVYEWFRKHGYKGSADQLSGELKELLGHDLLEQILFPWHQTFPDVTQQILTPSHIYGPIMYDAQGGVDGPRQVNMIAAAHITGGGVPEKGMRMVRPKGLGLALHTVFPDPQAVTSLFAIANGLPEQIREELLNEQIASETWNRGVGFLVVTEDQSNANRLIEIARRHNCEAAIIGEVIDRPEIHWREKIWKYD